MVLGAMNKRVCCANVQQGLETFPLLDLPEDMQMAVLSFVPLRQLAQLACFSKKLRIVYLDRVRERDAEVAVRLELDFTAEFHDGLSSAQTALPRDLFVDPQMDPLLQAAPEKCRSLARGLEAHGDQYQGFCLAGLADGRGNCTDIGGNTYSGEFHKGRCRGWGSSTNADGSTYVGQWNAGSFHGQGTFTRPSGESYDGEWDAGFYHGQGTLTCPSGQSYQGQWHMGIPHGYGTWTSAAGSMYIGSWVAGKVHGQGCEFFPNGERFKGEFKFDARDGLGYVTYPDGSRFAGVWNKGVLGASIAIT